MNNNDIARPTDPALVSDQAASHLAPSGFDPSRGTIHMRNGRVTRRAHVHGAGETWCGKKLLGEPDCDGEGVETFTSYGSKVHTTYDEPFVTCQACLDAFETSYRRAFPDGPKPIATFRLDSPQDMERANKVLSVEAMNKFFGPGGGGMAAFDAALRDSDRSGEAVETTGSTEGESADPKGIAQEVSHD